MVAERIGQNNIDIRIAPLAQPAANDLGQPDAKRAIHWNKCGNNEYSTNALGGQRLERTLNRWAALLDKRSRHERITSRSANRVDHAIELRFGRVAITPLAQ